MVVIASETLWWTWRVEDTFHKIKNGDKEGMKVEYQKQEQEFEYLTHLIIETNENRSDTK